MNITNTKAIYAAFFIGFIFLSNYLVEMLGRWHFNRIDNKEPFDILHTILPEINDCKWIVNAIPFGLILFIFMQPSSIQIMKEALLYYIMVLVIRALTTLSTILPKHERCVEPDFLQLFVGCGGCYDKIFSGHMSFVTIFTLVLLGHKNISLPAFISLNVIQAMLILLARTHYTVDVILGFVISYLVYDGDYHLFTNFFKGIGK
jgi:hypothetical protein